MATKSYLTYLTDPTDDRRILKPANDKEVSNKINQLKNKTTLDKRVSVIFKENLRSNKKLRQVLFDIRAGNSNLAKSLGEKSNHAMYQDQNPHRRLLSLQN